MNKPKLRFKGFTDDWKTAKLGDFGTFKNGVNKSKDDFGFGSPFINLLDIFGKNTVFNNNYGLINVNNKELNNYNLKKGDVIFVRSSIKPSGVGLTSVVIEDLKNTVYSGFLIRFREKESLLNLKFKIYCFNSPTFRKALINKSTTSANTNINQESLYALNIPYPSIQEQEKIGNFLMLVDKQINILKQQKTRLEDYKKTLSTKIFNQSLRFQGFTKKWQTVRLSDICLKAQSGGTPKSDNSDYYNGDISFLSINDMTTQGKYLTKTEKHITNKGIKNSSAWVVPINSIMYSMYASVGFVSINKIELSTSQAIINLILNNKNNVEYIYYYLSFYKKYLNKFIEKGTQENLNAKTIRNFIIPLPTLKEQEKIANVLSNIDKLITRKRNHLTQALKYKTYLLQNMFI